MRSRNTMLMIGSLNPYYQETSQSYTTLQSYITDTLLQFHFPADVKKGENNLAKFKTSRCSAKHNLRGSQADINNICLPLLDHHEKSFIFSGGAVVNAEELNLHSYSHGEHELQNSLKIIFDIII